MRYYILVLLLVLCGCCEDECFYNVIERDSPVSVFIYNDEIFQESVDSCHIIGTIGDISVNRRCNVIGPLIEIGSKNVFDSSEYYIDVRIYVSDFSYFPMVGKIKSGKYMLFGSMVETYNF